MKKIETGIIIGGIVFIIIFLVVIGSIVVKSQIEVNRCDDLYGKNNWSFTTNNRTDEDMYNHKPNWCVMEVDYKIKG